MGKSVMSGLKKQLPALKVQAPVMCEKNIFHLFYFAVKTLGEQSSFTYAVREPNYIEYILSYRFHFQGPAGETLPPLLAVL